MRWLFACLWLVLPVSLLAQSTSQLKSLGRDYEALGWEAVGRLDFQGGGFCSATLVASNLVLSAAHCVYDQSGRLRRSDEVIFRAGLRSGRSVAERRIAGIAAHPGFRPAPLLNARNVAHDLALLELAEPIPSHVINPFVLHNDTVRPGPVSIVSYGAGRENLQSRQRECRLLERHNNVLAFNCDVTFGSSGAPVFSHRNGRGRILSVISGGTREGKGKMLAYGPHLPPLVDALKRELRKQRKGPTAIIRRLRVGEGGANGAKFVKP